MNFWERGGRGNYTGGNSNCGNGCAGGSGYNGKGCAGGNGYMGNGYASGRGHADGSDARQNCNNGNGGTENWGGNAYAGASGRADLGAEFAKYSGKSEDQLMRELRDRVERMKADGTFDPAALENLYATAAPFLGEEQRRRMRQIIDMLRG